MGAEAEIAGREADEEEELDEDFSSQSCFCSEGGTEAQIEECEVRTL